MRHTLLLLPLLVFVFACNNATDENSETAADNTQTEVHFEKWKWREKEDGNYPYRDQMLDEVLHSDTIRSLNHQQIVDLLGEPDRVNNGYLYYTITQKRLGFWTLHQKSMVVKLTPDHHIDWIKIHE